MSRAKQQAQEACFLQLYKTEHVVRLESERREAKARLRLLDSMTNTLDDQLLYVAQFKKQWLQHRVQLEGARLKVAAAEQERRQAIAAEYTAELTTILRRYDPMTRHTRNGER